MDRLRKMEGSSTVTAAVGRSAMDRLLRIVIFGSGNRDKGCDGSIAKKEVIYSSGSSGMECDGSIMKTTTTTTLHYNRNGSSGKTCCESITLLH